MAQATPQSYVFTPLDKVLIETGVIGYRLSILANDVRLAIEQGYSVEELAEDIESEVRALNDLVAFAAA